MTNLATPGNKAERVWQRYQDNFPRHLLGVTRFLQAQTMHALIQECGHDDLRLNFEPYIAMIGDRGARLSDIAQMLGISRQAANQSANQIEMAGYIKRVPHPTDGRAKLAVLSKRGKQLRRDGTRVVARCHQQFVDIVGQRAIAQAITALSQLCVSLDLLPATARQEQPDEDVLIGALLPRISDHINTRLMQLTAQRGHPQLKPNFGQVLLFIGPNGGRIQHIAAINEVSKQAISAIASELEELGYIKREQDTRDARQVVLRFSGRGRALIADSVASIDQLEQAFARILGRDALVELQGTLKKLYRALHLEEDIFGNQGPLDIHALANQLRQQLGEEGAQALGQLLLDPTATEVM